MQVVRPQRGFVCGSCRPGRNARRAEAWTAEQSIALHHGILELGSSLPQVTVLAFAPEDLALFLTLAGALPAKLIAIDAPTLSEEDLRLASALTVDLKGGEERSRYRQVIADARPHLGKVHELTATAFAAGLGRAVVFRAATDWGAALFGVVETLRQQPD